MSENPRILVVDDETEMLVSCRKILESESFSVSTSERGKQALNLLAHQDYDLLICDLRLPDVDGLKILEACKKRSPDTFVIFITAFGTIESAVEAMRLKAFDYITKPFKKEQILVTVDKALKWRQTQLEG